MKPFRQALEKVAFSRASSGEMCSRMLNSCPCLYGWLAGKGCFVQVVRTTASITAWKRSIEAAELSGASETKGSLQQQSRGNKRSINLSIRNLSFKERKIFALHRFASHSFFSIIVALLAQASHSQTLNPLSFILVSFFKGWNYLGKEKQNWGAKENDIHEKEYTGHAWEQFSEIYICKEAQKMKSVKIQSLE